MIRNIAWIFILMAVGAPGWAQDKDKAAADSVAVTKDTTSIEGQKVETIVSYAKRFDPRKALLFAAVLPGAGQVYNKKYWKLPLVYGGLGLVVNAVSFYQRAYVKYKNDLYVTINGGIPASGLDQATLRSIVDEARRQRDFFMVIGGLVYILQMVDAHVDAHLKEFDLNPKLKVQLKPQFDQNMMIGRTTGISICFKF